MADANRVGDAMATVTRALALANPIWNAKRGDWQFAQWHVITLITQAQLLREQGRLADTLPALANAVERATQSLAMPLPAEGRAYLLEARGVALQTTATSYHHLTRPSLHRPTDALRFYDASEADARTLRDAQQALEMANPACRGSW